MTNNQNNRGGSQNGANQNDRSNEQGHRDGVNKNDSNETETTDNTYGNK
jgi:hypothetical protein